MMDDKEAIVRAIVLLEEVGKRLTSIEGKIETINNEKIQEIVIGLAVQMEKTSKLEKVVYGLLAIVFTQVIAFIVLWIQKK